MGVEEVVVRRRARTRIAEEVEEEEEGMGVEGVSVAQTRFVEDHGKEEQAG